MQTAKLTRIFDKLRLYILELILIAVIIFFAFTADNFFTLGNFFNILRNSSMVGIIALGMTMVIISGEIDLSIASNVAFSGCLCAFLVGWFTSIGLNSYVSVTISIIIPLIISFLIGISIALLKKRFNVPSFISTLAMLTIYSGFAFLISNGFSIVSFPQWFSFLGSGYVFKIIPFPVIIFIIVFLLLLFLMSYTTFGRSIYAVGGNEEAARLSGINVFLVKAVSLGITQSLAAISGVLVASQIMSGLPTVARGWEMTVISATIIGGASLAGGIGNIRGTLIGIIFLSILINGMTILNVNEYWQAVLRGALILAAVLINSVQNMRNNNSI